MSSKSNITELASIVSDYGLKHVFDSEILKDFPAVGTLIKLIGAYTEVRDIMLLKKIKAFLENYDAHSSIERERFRKRLREEKDKEKIGEALILCIEGADDIDKARLMGDVFKDYLSQEIDKEELLQLWYSINRCFLSDLKLLSKYKTLTTEGQDVGWRLLSAGLVGHRGIDGGSADSDAGGVIFQINEVGKLLIKHLENNEKTN